MRFYDRTNELAELERIKQLSFSDMQNIWDSYRKKTHINLIVSGSIYSLMQENFHYATYFSILSAISGGINTQPAIEAALGNKSLGGQLKRQQLAESKQFREIGSWWETKNGQNELDIVALSLTKNQAVAAEVKRNRKNFKPELLATKVSHLKQKVLPKYKIESYCLTLEEM